MTGWIRDLAEARVNLRALIAGAALALVFIIICAAAFAVGTML